ncbi:pentatricopeptide repeat (PPR) superfamily protein [Actinidia rufa]|uniref:Pentatricopeptide repeat (PPR) superfamily protein n=1 Tax=Actinidia rufa TaxID=165716 RepID=A0A7J0EDL1_9ERIC|nr:pentatricopeptide repeat (PPR) superfamily protein [Actinidia rufa]
MASPPPLTPPQIIRSVTSVLTSNNASLSSLTPFIPHLTPPLILSILSSKTLASRPTTLLSFFKWAQNHIPNLNHNPSQAFRPLLSLLTSLLSHYNFVDAKSLLIKFLAIDTRRDLHRLLLHPANSLPRHFSKARVLLDTAIGAYVQLGRPHLAVEIFKAMKRLQLRPNLLTCNTLLNSLVKYPCSNPVLICRELF